MSKCKHCQDRFHATVDNWQTEMLLLISFKEFAVILIYINKRKFVCISNDAPSEFCDSCGGKM